MIWTYPETFWFILAVPFVFAAVFLVSRRSIHSLKTILSNRLEWQLRVYLRDLFMMAFVVACLFAIADPKGTRQPETSEQSGLDIAVTFDISRSMLAEDIAPNRLKRSVEALRQIMNSLEAVRFSLIMFKGDAQLVVPMTNDRIIRDLWLERLAPELSTFPGSNMELALKKALTSFPMAEVRSRIILLITDGESLSGRINNVSAVAADEGVVIHSLAAGTREGGVIPLGDGTFAKDKSGYLVVTKPDIKRLNRIAEVTNGSVNEIIVPGAIEKLINTIQKSQQVVEGRGIRLMHINRFRFFIIPALVFLLLFLLLRIVPWLEY